VVVVNSQRALAQIAEHSESNLRSELGGVLLGYVYRDGDTLFVDVHAALPAVTNDRGPVHFTFTADAWSQIHRDRAAQYPKLDIVGWFHTHPGLGVFYSSDDVVVHTAAFTLPWHVGLVVDPVRYEAAYFGWQNGNIAPINGFYELTDVQEGAAVHWKAIRTSVYQLPEADIAGGAYAESTPVASPDQPAYVRRGGQWLSPSSRHLGLIIGSLALALGLLLLLAWVVPLNRRAQQMESVMLALANTAANPNALACPDPRLRLLSPITGNAARLGSEVEMLGTAVYPNTFRYQVQTRPTGQDEWATVGSQRRGTQFGTLATWKTAGLLPGAYEVRLTAVDRNSLPLPNSPACVIQMQLIQ
jgi:proteasome lid subunit RPN8/RPN11